jgi:HSP20 family protein
MSQVEIQRDDGTKSTAPSIFDEMNALSERIRQRAFEIFECRGSGDGFAMDDWLDAERDLLQIPEAELIEKEGRFEIRVSASAFNPDDFQVMALPDALIVKALSTQRHDESEGDVRFCEFGQKTLFRRFNLPEPIDLDKVTADLEKGVLQVTAPKAKQGTTQKVQSIAA